MSIDIFVSVNFVINIDILENVLSLGYPYTEKVPTGYPRSNALKQHINASKQKMNFMHLNLFYNVYISLFFPDFKHNLTSRGMIIG
jgi:hypothetical protein